MAERRTRRPHGTPGKVLLEALKAKPWQTAKELGPVLGYPAGTVLMILAEEGKVQRVPSTRRKAPYEYAVWGEARHG